MSKNEQQNYKKKMNAEFATDTDFNKIQQQNKQAEAQKQQASGIFSNGAFKTPKAPAVEFGSDTDVNAVKQQNRQAEAQKPQASGRFAKNLPPNNS